MTAGNDRGFTLLELLVALAAFGLLLTALAEATRFAIRAYALQAQRIEADADLDATDRTLRHLIGAIGANATADGPPHFVANRRSMGFTATLPILAWYPTERADVIVAMDTAHRLVLRWAPHYPTLLGAPPSPQVTTLLGGVDHIELSYWTAGTAHGVWVDRWEAATLPELVRLRIVFPPGDPRHWPDIVVATGVN
jgi:general secretion pathway protein J